jgi:hypothetical protein
MMSNKKNIDHERERINETPIRCFLHGTACVVAQENRGVSRKPKHGSHDRRYKDKRRHAKRPGGSK